VRVSGVWKLVLFLAVVAVVSFVLGYYGMMRFIL
jgi:hypothetical protein